MNENIEGLQAEQTGAAESITIRRANRSLLLLLRPFSDKGRLSVLECLANTESIMSAAQIVKETGLNLSTFFKYAGELGHLKIISPRGELVPGAEAAAGSHYVLTNSGSDLLDFVIGMGLRAMSDRDESILNYIQGYELPENIVQKIKDDLLLEREYLGKARLVPRFFLQPLSELTIESKMAIVERLLASPDPMAPKDLMESEGLATSTFFKYAGELMAVNIIRSNSRVHSLSPLGRRMATELIDFGETVLLDSMVVNDMVKLSSIYRGLSEAKKQQIRQIIMEAEN